MPHRFWKVSQRGQSLIPILVSAAIMAIVMTATISMFAYQSGMSRRIAAHSGVTDISESLDLLFGSPNCRSVGYFAYAGQAAIVTTGPTCLFGNCLLVDEIGFSASQPAVATQPKPNIQRMIQPYAVAPSNGTPPGIEMRSVGAGVPNGAGFVFPFQMDINFTSPKGPPPLPLTKSILIYTDASKTVKAACFVASSNSGGEFSVWPHPDSPAKILLLVFQVGQFPPA